MKKKIAIIDSVSKESEQKEIFDYFIDKGNLNLSVEVIRCNKDNFLDLIESLRSTDISGAILSPVFKDEAFTIADFSTERANPCRMANTMLFSDGQIYADNTYGHSLCTDIEKNIEISLAGKRILVIASNNNIFSAILSEIEKRDIKQLYLASRSPEKLMHVLEETNRLSGHIFSSHIDDINSLFDIIINTTNVIFSEKNNPFVDKPWAQGSLVYDINFSDKAANYFLDSAKKELAITSNGAGFWIEQAVETIYICIGLKIERKLIKDLRQILVNKNTYLSTTIPSVRVSTDSQQAQQSI